MINSRKTKNYMKKPNLLIRLHKNFKFHFIKGDH